MSRSTQRHTRLMKRTEDIHCLLFHCLTLLAYTCAFYLYLRPQYAGIEGPWSLAAFVTASVAMLAWCSGLDVPVNFHNQAHKPIFRSDWLNRWCSRLWTFSSGWPSFFFEHVHITVHHNNLLRHEDWTLPRRQPDGEFEPFLRYSVFHWPWRFAYHLYQDFTSDRYPPGTGEKALRELLIFLALWSIPFWINVEMALLLWVLPQWIGNITPGGAGMYAQHAGCVAPSEAHPHSHSNSSLSRFHNLTMFNLGYHMAHHAHPQVHWTDLPKVHDHLMKKVEDTTDPRVFEASYYTIANMLAKKDLGMAELDNAMLGSQAGGSFELATPKDYTDWCRPSVAHEAAVTPTNP